MFGSLVELQAAINRFLAETNAAPKPFVWTARPEHILEKVRRGNQALDQPAGDETGVEWRGAAGTEVGLRLGAREPVF